MKQYFTGRNRVRNVVFFITTVLILAFIWGNSMYSKQESAAESESVTTLLFDFFAGIVGAENVTDHLVRKIAHFVEFFAFGVSLEMLYAGLPMQTRRRIFSTAGASLLVALIDETIQIFSERGSMVADVWLDFSGALTGTLLLALALFCVQKIKNH